MLITFLLVLSAVKADSESVNQDALRKSRQLDLGLQDIRNPDGTPTTIRLQPTPRDNIISSYLPPILVPEITSAQSQQNLDFKSVNSVEKGIDLCKPPFDETCNFKFNSNSDSKIPKPSRDLVPPFNDLEQELLNKASSLFQETNEEIKTAVETQSGSFKTTTENKVTKILRPASTQSIARIIKTTSPKVGASTAEATNELRSYLPPQPDISPAAQTNVAAVQPANQNNDHHHGHHHDENFNICDDAFHAFLCAPLKARKRITGALPSNLQGQSSFINYQKALPKPDRETAPSNAFRNEYLPPKVASTNLIQSTSAPTFTTRKPVVTTTTTTTASPFSPPKFLPEPSTSNERFYLPPAINNSPPVKTTPHHTTSNVAFSTVRPSTLQTPPTSNIFTTRVSQNSIFPSVPTIPVFNSLSSNANNFYLPPDPNSQPAASLVSTAKNIFPVTTISPLSSTFVTAPIVTHIAPLPSNSIIITQKPRPKPTIPVTPVTRKSVQVPTFSSQPSNPSGSYLPPVNELRSASKPVSTTLKPSTKGFKFSEQSSNTDRAYLPPDPEQPAAAQISSAAVVAPQVKNPFHHGRDLCTDPFHSFLCVSAKPRKRITGQLPAGYRPESSNTNESRLKPEPSNQDANRVRADNPLDGASAQNVGYKYPNPVNPFPTSNVVSSTAAPVTGYSYPKPDKVFPLPSQQDVKIVLPSTTTKKPEPNLRPSEARAVAGYEYPKPDKIFPLPAGQENIKISTTTSPPTTGYSYPKPQKPFPLPSEQKEVRQKPKQKLAVLSTTLPTNTVTGYQYPRPEQSLKLPEKKGYSYPKPEKRLELPTETLESKHKLPQSHSNLEDLGNLGSAEFIPVNKLDDKRGESLKLIDRFRRFGERMKKREKETQLYKKQ